MLLLNTLLQLKHSWHDNNNHNNNIDKDDLILEHNRYECFTVIARRLPIFYLSSFLSLLIDDYV